MEPEAPKQNKISLPARPKQSALIDKYKEKIITNYFDLAFFNADKNVNQFELVFEPEIPRDSRKLIKQTVDNIEAEIIGKVGPYVLKGRMLWASPKDSKPAESVSFKSKFTEKDSKEPHDFVVKLQATKTFNLNRLYDDPELGPAGPASVKLAAQEEDEQTPRFQGIQPQLEVLQRQQRMPRRGQPPQGHEGLFYIDPSPKRTAKAPHRREYPSTAQRELL